MCGIDISASGNKEEVMVRIGNEPIITITKAGNAIIIEVMASLEFGDIADFKQAFEMAGRIAMQMKHGG